MNTDTFTGCIDGGDGRDGRRHRKCRQKRDGFGKGRHDVVWERVKSVFCEEEKKEKSCLFCLHKIYFYDTMFSMRRLHA